MNYFQNRTNLIFLGSRLLCSPLEALYALMIFILCKDMNASILQLTVLACLKPTVSLFAFYASSVVANRPNWSKRYLIIINLIGCLPCLMFPIVHNIWFYVVSYGIFMAALRSCFPVWCEVLKNNLGMDKIGKTISRGTSISYAVITLVPLLLSYYMDNNVHIWKFLFVALACLQLLNSFILVFLNVPMQQKSSCSNSIEFGPLKNAVKLCIKNPDLANYLFMFFLGGAGLIAIQPILPIFFKETMHLSYTQLTLAISFCKGIAFVVTSPLFARAMKFISIFMLNAYINLFSCMFIAFILASQTKASWIFVAYLMYGTMQAGCELSWNMSGPLFSGVENSTPFSSLNLALVGIRGCICPFLGQLLFLNSCATSVFITAGVLCFVSLIYSLVLNKKFTPHNKRKQNALVPALF